MATAAVTGGIAALGAGVLLGAPAAQAGLPPGTYFCWAHLVPKAQSCPPVPPWGTRWTPCPNSKGLLFTLDGSTEGCAESAYDPDRIYSFDCWGHNLILGKVCPATQPPEEVFTQCWVFGPPTYGIYGDCSPLTPL
ncbi:hypothetical protein BHQ15_00675 [Mycolicibacillus koreensis]|nr:hypothetical protein BHQ15_00675 [Mycolicibacillus koreensis]